MSYIQLLKCVGLAALFCSSVLISNEEKRLNDLGYLNCINREIFDQDPKNSSDKLCENVEIMSAIPCKSSGMDIIIISASSKALATYWEKRIEQTRRYLLHPEAMVICVDEDWAKGGAGNGLGTLYAYQKARQKAKEQWGIDILKLQLEGAAIAMYHTAGEGKRLAPLTISEFGVKSSVELPGLVHPITAETPDIMLITLLEATLKQSMIFGPSRKGRLSVFWSDQVFIPSNSCFYTPDSHIDILVKKIEIPSCKNWEQQKLDNYGIIAWDASGSAKLFDKCSYGVFQEILGANKAIAQHGIGISMGTFSLSTSMVIALLKEFKQELDDKIYAIDSDPHFWMPLTLDLDSYSAAMQARKVTPEFIKEHYERMQRFKRSFQEQPNLSNLNFFGAIDIGAESYWWDYGTIDSYYHNNMAMAYEGKENDLMRHFYNMSCIKKGDNDSCDKNSSILGCNFKKGKIKNSLVIGVSAENIDLEEVIMLNCAVSSVQAKHSLIYHIKETNAIVLEPRTVRADVFIPYTDHHLIFHSPIESDGKVNWKIKLPSNPCSWEEAIKLVSKVNR